MGFVVVVVVENMMINYNMHLNKLKVYNIEKRKIFFEFILSNKYEIEKGTLWNYRLVNYNTIKLFIEITLVYAED